MGQAPRGRYKRACWKPRRRIARARRAGLRARGPDAIDAFDKKALIVLVLAALIPMIPLVGTAIPLLEILSKLGEFMV